MTSRLRRFARNEVVFHEGDPGDTLHLISRGRVAVRTNVRSGTLIAGFVSGSFLLTVALLVVVGRLWWPVAFGYGAMSITAYYAYKRDKQAAQAGAWRTNEWTLIAIGLIGGWPGALIARHRFRHKTSKVAFQLAYWLSVALNLSGLAWLLAL